MEANILFVDDSRIKVDVCTRAIENELLNLMELPDIHIYKAYGYIDAVKIINSNDLNLIITDRMMPGIGHQGLGGDDLVKYIKSDKKSNIDVIVISGKNDDGVVKEMCEYEKQGVQYIKRADGEQADSQVLAAKVYNFYNNLKFNRNYMIDRDVNYGNVILNSALNTVSANDKTEPVTDNEFKALKLLIKNAFKQTFASFESINVLVYNDCNSIIDQSCKDRIAKIMQSLKTKLKKIDANIEIKSIRGKGYYVKCA